MDLKPIGHKVPLKLDTKRILNTIKKRGRKDQNRSLIGLLSVLPKPDPRIDRSIRAFAYIEKLRSEIKELTKKQAELLPMQHSCNCYAEISSNEADLSSHDVFACNNESISVTTSPTPTDSTTSNRFLRTGSQVQNVRLVFSQGHVTVMLNTSCINKNLFPRILTVIQSHDAEVVHANLTKEDEISFYFVHAKVLDEEKFPEKELLSALQALPIT
ncbi:hypothetical protein O6H91_Y054800 [Diphasiastrum complanatum]|nr:hypothetical protein O6H91_Y054800 [Diphasiastrum complanatum]